MPHIPQIDEMDCGPACLGMICPAFRPRCEPRPYSRALSYTARDGTSLKALCHAAAELGLAARGLKVSSRNLAQMPLPAIVHWEGDHWMVLWEVGGSHVMVNDPALGERKIPLEEFESRWTGHAALFDYTEALDERARNAGRRSGGSRPFSPVNLRSSFGQALALAGVRHTASIGLPDLHAMDRGYGIRAARDVALLAAGSVWLLMVALVLLVAANLARRYVLSLCLRCASTNALVDFITRRMLALPVSYFSTRHSGDIQRRFDGARQVRRFAVHDGLEGVFRS